MIHIAAKPEALLPGRAFDTGDFANFQKTQMTVVKSQLVLNAAVRNPEVAALELVQRQAAPVEWLMQELEVDFSMGPEVLRIALKGDDPEALKVVVNGVMKAYLEEFINNQEVKRRERLDQLKNLREKQQNVVRAKRELLETFTPKLGTGDPRVLAVWHEIKLKQLSNAKNELVVVQAELSKAELELRGLQKSTETALSNFAVSESEVEKLLETDALYLRQLDRVAQLDEEAAVIRQTAASTAAADAVLERKGTLIELEAARKVLERRRQELVPKITQRLRERLRGDLETKMISLREQIFLAGEKEKVLNKIVNDLASENEEHGKESFEMLQARADLEEEEKIARTLAAEMRALSTELLSPSRARPLDHAVVVRAGGAPRGTLFGAVAGIAALGLVLFVVAWREWRARRIHSAEDVAHGLGIRLVGTLPPLSRRFQKRLCQLGQADPALSSYGMESIDTFRTFLLHDACGHGIKTVMVTSAVAGEGKTSLSCQLAISLARAGRKTLLVDSDLRRSSVHSRFGLPQAPGLAEALRGEDTLAEVIQSTSIDGLHILTAGKGDSRAVRAIAERIRGILEEAKESFDFVLIDSAPVLSVADPLVIGQHVDGAILSTLRGVSRIPLAAAAQHRIAALGIPSLGAVVSGTREELYNFGYQPAA